MISSVSDNFGISFGKVEPETRVPDRPEEKNSQRRQNKMLICRTQLHL